MIKRSGLSDLKALLQRATSPAATRSEVTKACAAPMGTPAVMVLPSMLPLLPPSLLPPFAMKGKSEARAPGEIDFQRLMRNDNVTPLPPLRRAVISAARPTPIPKQRLRDEREVMALAKYGEEPSPAIWGIGQELKDDQTFMQIGLSPDVLRNLRRGQWAIQRELDLHGLNADEAHDALVDFLIEARSNGLRCVRVIHGKGLASPDKTPVLKGKVRRWLSLWNHVLAYCEPAGHLGGGGAVVVLLRGC